MERVRATEVDGEERDAAVAAYVRRFGWLTGRFFDARRSEGREGIRRIAGRHPTFRIGALVLVATLALTAPALGARAGYRVSEGALPADANQARAMLKRALARAPAGSQAKADISWVLKLDHRHLLRRGQPLGRRSTVARTLRLNAWWYSRNTAPNSRIIVRDHTGVLSTYWEGRGLAVNPVATTGRWQDLNAGLTPEQLADALLPFAVTRRAGGRSFLLWEYYDVPDRPRLVRPGRPAWPRGASPSSWRAPTTAPGEPRFAHAAAGALASFTVPVSRGGVVSEVGPLRRRGTSSGPTRARGRGRAPPSTGSWSPCSTSRPRAPLPHLPPRAAAPRPRGAEDPAAGAGRREGRRGGQGHRRER